MRGGTVLIVLALAAACGSAAPAQDATDQRSQLAVAKAQSAAAAARSVALERQAANEQDQARQARAREAALAARVQQAEADVAAGQARIAIVARLLETQRARLATQQQPVARLLAALQSLARRPAVISVVQPGSIDDIVHVRAVLASTLPAIQARTQGVRAELARTRLLQAQAALAGQALAEGRTRLEAQRLALSRLEAAHRLRARALGRDALFESDRAIALGETARDLVDLMDQADTLATTRQKLASLLGPEQRPARPGTVAGVGATGWSSASPPYRLPVSGRIETGFGELSDAGVRSRGLTIVTAGSARVVAPASGLVAFAGPFRGYGSIVILNHGGGWTSLIAGLGETTVRAGQRVAQDRPIGSAAMGTAPRVTIELRRRDRPIDMTPLLG